MKTLTIGGGDAKLEVNELPNGDVEVVKHTRGDHQSPNGVMCHGAGAFKVRGSMVIPRADRARLADLLVGGPAT